MLRAVIFDLDGTLFDSHYDWKLIRKKLGVKDAPILSYLNNLTKEKKKKSYKLLETFEQTATEGAVLRVGIKKLISYLGKKNIKKAIVTNNSRKSVFYLMKKWNLTFDTIVTRDDGVWKPSGRPLKIALKKLNVKMEDAVYIGNSDMDRKAAEELGIKFFMLREGKSAAELIPIIEKFIL